MKVFELINLLKDMPQESEVQMDVDWTTAPISGATLEVDGVVILNWGSNPK